MSELTATLAHVPLLRGLDEATLNGIATRAEPVHLQDGEVLFRQGDAGDALYLLISGSLRVSIDGGAVNLAVFSRGDVVGELALLAGVARSADVVATEYSTLLKLDRIHALGVLGAHPALTRRIMAQIALRLAQRPVARGLGEPPDGVGVRVYQLRPGTEPALRAQLETLPASARELSGVRSLQIFLQDRTVVSVWRAGAGAEAVADPLFAIADDQQRAAFEALFEAVPAAGSFEPIYQWQAPDLAQST